MPGKQKIDFGQLEAGYKFPTASYQLDTRMVSAYIRAVEETGTLYKDSTLVPPMAIAALAMSSLSKSIALPGGTIHVSQELEFIDPVNINDTITCHASVIRKQQRGKLNLMSVKLNVFNQTQEAVLSGKTSFILPQED